MSKIRILMIGFAIIALMFIFYNPIRKSISGTDREVETTYNYVDGEIVKVSETVKDNSKINLN